MLNEFLSALDVIKFGTIYQRGGRFMSESRIRYPSIYSLVMSSLILSNSHLPIEFYNCSNYIYNIAYSVTVYYRR